jgi:hypothetical protein
MRRGRSRSGSPFALQRSRNCSIVSGVVSYHFESSFRTFSSELASPCSALQEHILRYAANFRKYRCLRVTFSFFRNSVNPV